MLHVFRQIYNIIFPYETRLWLYKQRHREQYHKLRNRINPSKKGDFSLKPYDANKCIFVHITKTAGTSVAKSLFGFLPYHYTAIDYRVIFGRENFNNYFKFAFVRNPWDRLYSAYRYLKSGGWDDKDKLWSETNLGQFSDFNTFVKQWVSTENIKKHLHFRPQCYFVCDKKGRLLIDYLAYFETINDDFEIICNRLGLHTELGRHNANPGNNYRDIYDEESKEIVASVYSMDIRLFGYDFNGIKERQTFIHTPS